MKPAKQIVSGAARHAALAFPGGGNQSGLCLVKCETFRQGGIVTSFYQLDEPGRQRHALFAREVRRVTGPAQQALHLARPVLFFDLNQRLKFAQVVRVAQCVQNAFQRVVRFPMIVDDDAQDVFHKAAPFRGDPVKRQPDRRCDMQPLRFAADPEAGFVHVFDRCRRHPVPHRRGEALETRGTTPAHCNDRRGHEMHTEQIGHQRGQAFFGQ